MVRQIANCIAAAASLAAFTTLPASAQQLTTGTYVMNQGGNCATLVLRGAGPQGNEYRYDRGCNGQDIYVAQSVRVRTGVIQVDGGRMVINSVDPNGFNADFILGQNRSRGLIYTRQ